VQVVDPQDPNEKAFVLVGIIFVLSFVQKFICFVCGAFGGGESHRGRGWEVDLCQQEVNSGIKPTLRMGDGPPFAGGQGQAAGPETTELGKSNNWRGPVQTETTATKAASTTTRLAPKKKKRKRIATADRIAVKDKKRDQSGSCRRGARIGGTKTLKK